MTNAPDGIHRDQPDGDDPDGSMTGRDEDDPGWPISFLVLVGAGALYLLLRVFEMIKSLVT
ncbi:MAG: hypothetical protein DWP92_05605 [Armatimonadetes bacterium]|nr:MAG: hypothetical protein DWP92_05605 [Armatimonadota bacterium]